MMVRIAAKIQLNQQLIPPPKQKVFVVTMFQWFTFKTPILAMLPFWFDEMLNNHGNNSNKELREPILNDSLL